MKLVVDTNTIISGAPWHGAPARLISAALRGQAQIFLSLPMLLELREALQHPKFAQRLAGGIFILIPVVAGRGEATGPGTVGA
ncbi:MAG: putative toxin-antitoxin system toxin component, PIN family [Limisphaerales bacterium]